MSNSSLRNFALVALGCVGATVGCDSLNARRLAGDAANLYHEGKIEEAEAKYEEAARLDPNIRSIQLNIAFTNVTLYQQNPKSTVGTKAAEKAIDAFETFLKLKPNDERAREYLVQTFVDTGKYEAAVAFFKPEVERAHPSGEALGTLGLIANKTGKFAEAKDWYMKRVSAEPNNPESYLAVGVLIWDYLHNHKEVVGQPRRDLADEGIKVLGDAIRVAPKAPNAYTYTNLLYRERAEAGTTDDEKRPDLEKAVEFFKKAMELQKAAK
jgi:tetratricopeptide (TPR) repeat protein